MKLELYNVLARPAPNDSQSEFVASGDLHVFWLVSLNSNASPITLGVLTKISQLIKNTVSETASSDPEELLLALGGTINNKINALIKPLATDKLELLVGACDQNNLVFSYRGNFYLLFQDQEKLFIYPTGESKLTGKFLTELESTDISNLKKIFFATSGFKSSLLLKKFQDHYFKNGSKPLSDLIHDGFPNEILKFSCVAFNRKAADSVIAESTSIKPAGTEAKTKIGSLILVKKYFGWIINKILRIKEYLTPKALEEGLKNFQALNRRTKAAFVLLILVSTALISATSHYLITSAVTKKLKSTSDHVTKIMAIKNAIKDNLSQGDLTGAKEKIKLTITQLLELKNDKVIDDKTYQSLKNLIQDEWFKINKITEVDLNAVLFNFDAVLKDEENKTVLSLVAANNKVYGITADGIYEIILGDKLIKKVFDLQLPDAAAVWRKCAGADGLIYCLGSNNKIKEFSLLDNKNRELALSQTGAITDFAIYENRLYVLVANERQIYRYDLKQNLPLKSESWLKDANIDLADASTIAVDGFVYVAKASGEIIKFSRGQKAAWQPADDIDPALAESLSAQTSHDLNSLFLLEPNNKRLIYLNKDNGSLAGQLYSESLSTAKSFCLSGGKVYLLANQDLYGLSY